MTLAELKAYIVARIKTNGQKAITGSIQQDVLLKMADCIVAGITLPEENFPFYWVYNYDLEIAYTRADFLALLKIDGDTLDRLMDGGIAYIDSPYHESRPRSIEIDPEEMTHTKRYLLEIASKSDTGSDRMLRYYVQGETFYIIRDKDGYHIGSYHDVVK